MTDIAELEEALRKATNMLDEASGWLGCNSVVNHGDLVDKYEAFIAEVRRLQGETD